MNARLWLTTRLARDQLRFGWFIELICMAKWIYKETKQTKWAPPTKLTSQGCDSGGSIQGACMRWGPRAAQLFVQDKHTVPTSFHFNKRLVTTAEMHSFCIHDSIYFLTYYRVIMIRGWWRNKRVMVKLWSKSTWLRGLLPLGLHPFGPLPIGLLQYAQNSHFPYPELSPMGDFHNVFKFHAYC